MQMPRHPLCFTAIMAAGLATATANAAEKSQYTCRSGDLVRRIVVEVQDLNTGLPCEVVYWKDSEAPGVRRVLWNARTDAQFCDAKAKGLSDKLDVSGWDCSSASASFSALEPAAAPPQPQLASREENPVVPQNPVQTATAAPLPQTQLSAVPASPVVPAPVPVEAVPRTQTAALAPSTAEPVPQPETNEQLQTVIQQNLESLNKSVDGDFEAEVGRFGDLNADGLVDAVVFFNYESSTDEFTQFVAAYLFNGSSYHLAATKPVGGTERAVQKVEVENIIDGSILLKLHLHDASQTADRNTAMTLRDGQLVEVE